jgi:hypothetical protein
MKMFSFVYNRPHVGLNWTPEGGGEGGGQSGYRSIRMNEEQMLSEQQVDSLTLYTTGRFFNHLHSR